MSQGFLSLEILFLTLITHSWLCITFGCNFTLHDYVMLFLLWYDLLGAHRVVLILCSFVVYTMMRFMFCLALCLCVSSVLLAFWAPCLGTRGLVLVLIVHLFVSYAHVHLCHFFSSSWCQGFAATSACGSSWTFLFPFCMSRLLYLCCVERLCRCVKPGKGP